MEKSKPSTEEIIKLGEKIVQELNIEPRFDTLSNWMANYVAELIHKAKSSNSDEEKRVAETECCEVILKIWGKRESLPGVKAPLTDLEPLIEVLEAINSKDNPKRFRHLFPDNFDDSNSTMKDFVEVIKSNTEDIFLLNIYSTLGSDLIKQKKELQENFEDFLNKDEVQLLDQINQLLNPNKLKFISSKAKEGEEKEIKFEDLSVKEWHNFILDRIEFHLEDQKNKYHVLKEAMLKLDANG